MADTDIGIMPEDMLVVTNLEFRYDPAQVEEWITRGEVDGVTLYPTRSREELLLITEETLEDLPSESPL